MQSYLTFENSLLVQSRTKTSVPSVFKPSLGKICHAFSNFAISNYFLLPWDKLPPLSRILIKAADRNQFCFHFYSIFEWFHELNIFLWTLSLSVFVPLHFVSFTSRQSRFLSKRKLIYYFRHLFFSEFQIPIYKIY